VGQAQKPGWGVSYVVRVRVVAHGVIREGTGAGHGVDVDLGNAHESAVKEAETDAMKRALMTFGNPFGLALYDKTKANVEADRPEPSAAEIKLASLIKALDGAKTLSDLQSIWVAHAKTDEAATKGAIAAKDRNKARLSKEPVDDLGLPPIPAEAY
jgi:recombination DNA repair RAD52 pathway protein